MSHKPIPVEIRFQLTTAGSGPSSTATTISYVQCQTSSSIPTCPYGRSFSPKTRVVRPAYSIETAVVIAAIPKTVSAGTQPPLKILFSLLNPEIGTHGPDRSVFETWELRMRRWRQRAPPRDRQGNYRRNGPGNGRPHYINNWGHDPTYQGNPPGISRAHALADA